MKVVMTQTELDRLVKSHQEDSGSDDSLIMPSKTTPSGWAVYVRMNHWDKTIDITVEGK